MVIFCKIQVIIYVELLRNEWYNRLVTEALAVESYKNIRPAVFETVMKEMLMKRSTDLSSYYAERETAAINYYNEVIASYMEK